MVTQIFESLSKKIKVFLQSFNKRLVKGGTERAIVFVKPLFLTELTENNPSDAGSRIYTQNLHESITCSKIFRQIYEIKITLSTESLIADFF